MQFTPRMYGGRCRGIYFGHFSSQGGRGILKNREEFEKDLQKSSKSPKNGKFRQGGDLPAGQHIYPYVGGEQN